MNCLRYIFKCSTVPYLTKRKNKPRNARRRSTLPLIYPKITTVDQGVLAKDRTAGGTLQESRKGVSRKCTRAQGEMIGCDRRTMQQAVAALRLGPTCPKAPT
ncbi:hypothetical protein BHE74_00048605 [Ensete ventricosum]|nr:hypothetical protein BHE74_00048605 [Ensete ventricosum]